MELVERFLKYVKIDTQSNFNSTTTPTTKSQLQLAKILVEDMKNIGIKDCFMDCYGVVYAKVPSNVKNKCDAIGLIGHLDTSPDMCGKGIQPKIIRNYDGKDIILNKEKNIILSPTDYPSLNKHIGEDLIVTDGTTLLGADDKAGVVEILECIKRILEQNLPHGDIVLAFTPDEEVGQGTEHFDIEKFSCDYAYTIDGGPIDEINIETFNAASAVVTIEGVNTHPGSAKNKMINALKLAMRFDSLLPIKDTPSLTEGYEGFNHLNELTGECEKAQMKYLIRNHDKQKLEKQKRDFYLARDFINQQYERTLVQVIIQDEYDNMKERIQAKMEIVTQVEDAMKEIGITPKCVPVRGGTDGAELTMNKGVLTPNLGTGGDNYHSKFEYCSILEMEQAVEILTRVLVNNTKKQKQKEKK